MTDFSGDARLAVRLAQAAERHGCVVADVRLRVENYSWRRRVLSWLLWRLPVVRLVSNAVAKRHNPYRRVVAILRPKEVGQFGVTFRVDITTSSTT